MRSTALLSLLLLALLACCEAKWGGRASASTTGRLESRSRVRSYLPGVLARAALESWVPAELPHSDLQVNRGFNLAGHMRGTG